MSQKSNLDPTQFKSPPIVLTMKIDGKTVADIPLNGWLVLRLKAYAVANDKQLDAMIVAALEYAVTVNADLSAPQDEDFDAVA